MNTFNSFNFPSFHDNTSRNILNDQVLFPTGFNPVFDETFEFHINLPKLALVRFVVQDDDFIGDGFIGPLSCIQPGENYKWTIPGLC